MSVSEVCESLNGYYFCELSKGTQTCLMFMMIFFISFVTLKLSRYLSYYTGNRVFLINNYFSDDDLDDDVDDKNPSTTDNTDTENNTTQSEDSDEPESVDEKSKTD